jgi:hypothetical protein
MSGVKKIKRLRNVFVLLAVFFGLGFFNFVFASIEDGTIDSTYKYAWSNNMGWINFGTTNGNVHVTSAALTGYAWSENYGWINLAPANSGVKNTTLGVLSGYAWGENTGWINFSGVSINYVTGVFSGTATGDTVGTITFSCSNCRVVTDWRGGGGGGGDESHNECNSQGQCVSVSGAGSNACQTNNDCLTRKVCNAQNQCVTAAGSGSDQCQTNENCITTHNECNSQGQCVAISGSGINQCQTNSECVIAKHNECNAQKQCVAINGSGFDLCLTDADCNKTHNECQNQLCVVIDGVGTNQCLQNSDCVIQKHNECNSQGQCIAVDGAGSDQCQTSSDCGGGDGGDGGGIIYKHNVCSEEKCLSVEGEGQDECQTDENCKSVVEKIIEKPAETVQIITEALKETTQTAVKNVEKVVNTPQGSAATKTISTTGVAVEVIATASTFLLSPFSWFELFLLPLRLLGLLLTFFGFKKKALPWGVVYDSVTKQPIDPAYVELINEQNKSISTAITDIEGRYGFLAKPGFYTMSAKKTNYKFPSEKLAGKTEDELYNNLYFGKIIEIRGANEAIIKNIPLDPLKFDWNEFAKKNKKLIKFYSKLDIILAKLSNISFIIGFVVAVIAYFFAPYPYNLVIVLIYLFLLILRTLGLKPKAYGRIFDRITDAPLSFAVLKVIMPDSNQEIGRKVADQYGRYYCLVPKGRYYVTIERKNDDGTYSWVFTSQIIDASKKGMIKNTFRV